MKNLTISEEFANRINATESKLALKDKGIIYLVNSIKTGRNRTYLEIQNGKEKKTRNLRTIIKRGMELIDSTGQMYTPKSWTGSMFILNDGKILSTGYATEEEKELEGEYQL